MARKPTKPTKPTKKMQTGGKVPSAQAMGRSRSGQKAQSDANARMVDALQIGNMVRHGVDGGYTGPAQYGNLKNSSGRPARKLSPEAAVRVNTYAKYGSLDDAEKKLAKDRKQAKEGRR